MNIFQTANHGFSTVVFIFTAAMTNSMAMFTARMIMYAGPAQKLTFLTGATKSLTFPNNQETLNYFLKAGPYAIINTIK